MCPTFKKIFEPDSGKEGTEHFWRQRLTSIANVPLVIFLLWQLISLIGKPYPEIIDRLSSPIVTIVMILAIISIVCHMKLGMQMIIEDYAHGESWKVTLLSANIFFSVAIGMVCIFSLLKICFVTL